MDRKRRSIVSPGSRPSFKAMSWLSSIFSFLGKLIGLGKSVVDNKREERALANSPEIRKRESQRIESAESDRAQKTVEKAVRGDKKSLDDIRRELGP